MKGQSFFYFFISRLKVLESDPKTKIPPYDRFLIPIFEISSA